MRRLLTQQGRQLEARQMRLLWLGLMSPRLQKRRPEYQIWRLLRAARRLGRAGKQRQARLLPQLQIWRLLRTARRLGRAGRQCQGRLLLQLHL